MKMTFAILTFLLISCKEDKKEVQASVVVGSEIKSFNFNGLADYIDEHPSETLVINFWATWCAPCIKELPAFEKLGENYADKDVSVLLVSLDFPDQLEKLKEFVTKKKLQSEVIFLDDGDANTWIPKINENWSGAIPATLIKTSKRKEFYERSFSYTELEEELKLLIN